VTEPKPIIPVAYPVPVSTTQVSGFGIGYKFCLYQPFSLELIKIRILVECTCSTCIQYLQLVE